MKRGRGDGSVPGKKKERISNDVGSDKAIANQRQRQWQQRRMQEEGSCL